MAYWWLPILSRMKDAQNSWQLDYLCEKYMNVDALGEHFNFCRGTVYLIRRFGVDYHHALIDVVLKKIRKMLNFQISLLRLKPTKIETL